MEIDFPASALVTHLDSPASPDTLSTQESIAAPKQAIDKIIQKNHRCHPDCASQGPGIAFGLALAVLPKTIEAREIFKKLSKICDLSGIRVEAPHNKGGPGQCHRCQRYGPAAANYHAQPRYVKCLVPHWPKEFTRMKESKGKPDCVNCGSDHPASYRGCSKATKTKSKRNNYRNNRKNKAPYVPTLMVRDDRNFPDLDEKNLSKAVNGGFRPAPAPSTNSWFRNQLPRAASEPPKEANRRGPPASYLDQQATSPAMASI